MDPEIRRNQLRDALVMWSLVVLMVALIGFFLFFVSFGVFVYVFVAVGVFTLVGYLHYLLWGYEFSRSVAGEKQEIETKEAEQREIEERSVQDLSRRPRRRY